MGERIAAVSTFANAFALNCLVIRTVAKLADARHRAAGLAQRQRAGRRRGERPLPRTLPRTGCAGCDGAADAHRARPGERRSASGSTSRTAASPPSRRADGGRRRLAGGRPRRPAGQRLCRASTSTTARCSRRRVAGAGRGCWRQRRRRPSLPTLVTAPEARIVAALGGDRRGAARARSGAGACRALRPCRGAGRLAARTGRAARIRWRMCGRPTSPSSSAGRMRPAGSSGW